MKKDRLVLWVFGVGVLLGGRSTYGQNPLILDQFTADPTARVFEGRVYVYPSHDIPASPGRGRANWFVMEDYHVFSSENLVDWKDHGVILNQTQVPWLRGRQSFDMWAPDCVFKNGKYYFYFPTGGRIGVAVADKPYGPFVAEPNAIPGVRGIDPGVLVDKDGSAYLFWGGISMAKLKDNMVELDSQPQRVENLPRPGLIEGPFPFERNGIYYLTYPHVQNKTERLEYSVAKSPLGPYEWKGVIMDELPSGCWTIHGSMVEYKGQWYLFYHDKDLSPQFDKNRSIRADFLYFNEDGTIRKVTPTQRGVGVVDARSKIQIDRVSDTSPEGTSVSFLNEANKNEGWKISLSAQGAWARFNRVDFGKGDLKTVHLRALSSTGTPVEIRLDSPDGALVAPVEIPRGSEWTVTPGKLATVPSGVHDLVVRLKEGREVELDWIRFE